MRERPRRTLPLRVLSWVEHRLPWRLFPRRRQRTIKSAHAVGSVSRAESRRAVAKTIGDRMARERACAKCGYRSYPAGGGVCTKCGEPLAPQAQT